MATFRRPSGPAAAGDAIPFESGGVYHLFYLSSPPGTLDYPERVRTSWQHSTTADLQSWTPLPPALEPGPDGGVDSGGIWTGSVVEHDGRFWLFYTAHDPTAANPQTICLATSTDLVHFERHLGNPLLTPVDSCEPVDWRDPYVFFNADEGVWWMLIAARSARGPRWRRGVIMLATSSDLEHWTVEPEPLYDPGTTFCPECPELWSMGERWYLVYSRFSEDVGTVYRVADSPRGPFRTPADERLGGRRWYAAKSAANPTGQGRVFFGWVHDEAGDGPNRRWLWGGDFAVPRVATAQPDGRLVLEPVLPDALQRLGGDPVNLVLGRAGSSESVVLLSPVPAMVLVDVDVEADGAAEWRLDLVDEEDRGWSLSWRPRARRLELRVTPEPLDDFWADLTDSHEPRGVDGSILAATTVHGAGTSAHVRVLLDGDVLEVFVDAASPLTHRVRRGRGLRLLAAANDGVVRMNGRVVS